MRQGRQWAGAGEAFVRPPRLRSRRPDIGQHRLLAIMTLQPLWPHAVGLHGQPRANSAAFVPALDVAPDQPGQTATLDTGDAAALKRNVQRVEQVVVPYDIAQPGHVEVAVIDYYAPKAMALRNVDIQNVSRLRGPRRERLEIRPAAVVERQAAWVDADGGRHAATRSRAGR